nr:hypothetical protein Iba_chr04cCG7280 [Ipomoea batatas]
MTLEKAIHPLPRNPASLCPVILQCTKEYPVSSAFVESLAIAKDKVDGAFDVAILKEMSAFVVTKRVLEPIYCEVIGLHNHGGTSYGAVFSSGAMKSDRRHILRITVQGNEGLLPFDKNSLRIIPAAYRNDNSLCVVLRNALYGL